MLALAHLLVFGLVIVLVDAHGFLVGFEQNAKWTEAWQA
jgi:hypothetical protein